MTYTWYTHLSPEECQQRLVTRLKREANSIAYSLRSQDRKPKTFGPAEAYTFELRHLSGITNSWAPHFYGTMRSHKKGAVIRGQFRAPLSVRVFNLFALVLLGIIFSAPSVAGLVTGDPVSADPGWWGLGAFVLCFYMSIVWYGRYFLGKENEGYLTNFLKNTFEF